MASATQQQIDQVTQAMAADPEFQQLLGQYRQVYNSLQRYGRKTPPRGTPEYQQFQAGRKQMQDLDMQIRVYRRDKGWSGDATHDWTYSPAQGTFKKDSFWERNPLLTAGLLAGGAAVGAGVINAGLAGGGSTVVGGTTAAGGGSSAAGSGLAAAQAVEASAGPITSAGMSSAMPGSMATVGAGGSVIGGPANAGGSWIDKVMGNKDKLGEIAQMGESYANDEARNRITRGNFAQQYDRIRLQGREDDRAQEREGLRNLAITGYLKSGGRPYNAASAGLPYSYGFGPKAPSAAQAQGAGTLEEMLLKRLTPEGQFQPTPLDTYAKAGLGENIGRYGGMIANGIRIGKGLF